MMDLRNSLFWRQLGNTFPPRCLAFPSSHICSCLLWDIFSMQDLAHRKHCFLSQAHPFWRSWSFEPTKLQWPLFTYTPHLLLTKTYSPHQTTYHHGRPPSSYRALHSEHDPPTCWHNAAYQDKESLPVKIAYFTPPTQSWHTFVPY